MLALGTSLTAGYGLPHEAGFTAVLEAALRAKGHDVQIIDGGVSGDTSAGGLARLEWSLADPVDAVIVELGANDALRGLSPAETEANIKEILDTLAARKLPTLLAGMMAPRNLGPEYAAAFDPLYARLAERYGSVFYPFFLDGVAGELSLNQGDGIHPNAAGVKHIVDHMLPAVETLLGRVPPKTPQAKTAG